MIKVNERNEAIPVKKEMQPMKEDILTLEEAASLLRLSKMTVLRLANQGSIPGARIGRLWRFSRETIVNLVKHPQLIEKAEKHP